MYIVFSEKSIIIVLSKIVNTIFCIIVKFTTLITYFYYDSPSKYDFLLNLPTRQWSRGRHERDHIGGRVSCIDIITPDLTENAEYVNEAWRTASQSRLAGIFQTGRRLIEIRDRYIDPATGMARAKADEGKCSRLIGDNQWSGQSLLLFEATHTKRLIRIAESSCYGHMVPYCLRTRFPALVHAGRSCGFPLYYY